MKNITVPQLRKYLKTLDKEELEELFIDVFKNNTTVKKQVSFIINKEEYGEEILNDYKKKMDREFHKLSTMFSLRTLNGYLSSFKNEVNGDNELYADLLLHYSERLTEFMDEFEVNDEKYENALTDKFLKVIKIVSKDEFIYNRLKDRMKTVIDNPHLNNYDLVAGFYDEYCEIPWLTEEERNMREEDNYYWD